MATMTACLFCKIIKGDTPCFKIFESDKTLAFLDIHPLSKGHALVIPKHHGAKLSDVPDEHLIEIMPTLKRVIKATGASDYNLLQNNGRIAHQEIDHVHFHMIPKPNKSEGLGIEWPSVAADHDKLKALCEDIKSRM